MLQQNIGVHRYKRVYLSMSIPSLRNDIVLMQGISISKAEKVDLNNYLHDESNFVEHCHLCKYHSNRIELGQVDK